MAMLTTNAINNSNISNIINTDSFSSQSTVINNKQQQEQQQQQQQQQQLKTFSNLQQSQQQQYSISSNLINNTSTNSNSYLNNSNRLDRLPIQIDSLNNNNDNLNINNNLSNNNLINIDNTITSAKAISSIDIGSVAAAAASSRTRSAITPCYNVTEQLDLEAGNLTDLNLTKTNKIKNNKMKRNTSLISFKSFDFHIKSIYSGLRNKSNNKLPDSDKQHRRKSGTLTDICTKSKSSSSTIIPTITGSGAVDLSIQQQQQQQQQQRKTPFVRVEAVDTDETQNLLNYPQSPYQSRRSSYEPKSSSQLLNIHQYEQSRSQASSPSPFLCPSPLPGNIRRSSTSDIMCKKPSSSSAVSSRRGSSADSRRPSTSDLLRRNRERKGSEGHSMMGTRSLSHSGLPRGGYRGGRRTSMAF